MKTKRRKWRPPTEHPPVGVSVLCVVQDPKQPGRRWMGVSNYASGGGWPFEYAAGCKVVAWSHLSPLPELFPWEKPMPESEPNLPADPNAPVPKLGYRLLRKGDEHVVGASERVWYSNSGKWDESGFVGFPAKPRYNYEVP